MLHGTALYCRDDTTKMSGHFDGYVEVHRKDEVAVMEALMKHGPLAVGVDATFDEFLFYRWVDSHVLGTMVYTCGHLGTVVYWCVAMVLERCRRGCSGGPHESFLLVPQALAVTTCSLPHPSAVEGEEQTRGLALLPEGLPMCIFLDLCLYSLYSCLTCSLYIPCFSAWPP
jgi:hypothetical protein